MRPPERWLMCCELILIFIVGHSSCAHRVSIRSLTRFHQCFLVSCSPPATGPGPHRALRCQLDHGRLLQRPAFAGRRINTPARDATMHLGRAVRCVDPKPVIGIHRMVQTRRAPIVLWLLVCDTRHIYASVHGWPWAPASVAILRQPLIV